MKIRKGDTSVKLPIGELCAVVLDEGIEKMLGHIHMVTIVTAQQLDEFPKQIGRITHVALTQGTISRLHFWPTPDKACTLRIRYYPPMQEI